MNSHDKDRAGDDLTALARLLPPPPEVELPPERHRDVKDKLMRQIDQDLTEPTTLEHGEAGAERTGTGIRRTLLRPRFLLPAAVALTLVTGITVTLDGGGGHGSDPAASPASAPAGGATVLLDHIAAAAGENTEGTKAPGADQYVYTRILERENKGEFGGAVRLGAAHTEERWMSQDPDPVTKTGAIRETGQDAIMPGQLGPIEVGTPDGAEKERKAAPGLRRPTYAWLASLPTDPDELLKRLYAEVPDDGRQTPDQAVFQAVGDLVANQLMPPENAAALYRAIARIPGVRKVSDVVDAAGRHGVGITLKDTAYATRDVWIFDPDTFAYLGSRGYLAKDGKPGGDEVLYGITAVKELGVADRIGAKPEGARAAG